MDNTDTTALWKNLVSPQYQDHPRSHDYALTPEAQRQLVALYRACQDTDKEHASELFKWALQALADLGVNVLQPRPPAELKPPSNWTDLWGNPLPNPFTSGDVKGQTILTQRDPELAKWLKKFAENPIVATAEWQDLLLDHAITIASKWENE
jgi:hypothetical protein